VDLRVLGMIPDYSWNRGTVFMDRATLKQVFSDDRIDLCDVYAQPDAVATGENNLRAYAAGHAVVVATRAELRDYIANAVRRLYALVQVQQLVVGIVAALGVVTALLISGGGGSSGCSGPSGRRGLRCCDRCWRRRG
jgi:putative ABC transport system permease protein